MNVLVGLVSFKALLSRHNTTTTRHHKQRATIKPDVPAAPPTLNRPGFFCGGVTVTCFLVLCLGRVRSPPWGWERVVCSTGWPARDVVLPGVPCLRGGVRFQLDRPPGLCPVRSAPLGSIGPSNASYPLRCGLLSLYPASPASSRMIVRLCKLL